MANETPYVPPKAGEFFSELGEDDKCKNESHIPVFIDGKEVGSMNAMAYSPRLDKNICYTILDIEHAKSGQEIVIASPEKDLIATTVDLPWHERT